MYGSSATGETRLVSTTMAMRDALLEMAEEWCAAGEDRYAGLREDFDGWLRKSREMTREENCPEGVVPGETRWLVDRDGRVLGRCSVRYRLLPHLEREGGHIGYDVRPGRRGEGHATRMLGLALERARELGLSRVLLTCGEDNVASAKVIETNGGIEFGSAVSDRSGKTVRRFWIHTGDLATP